MLKLIRLILVTSILMIGASPVFAQDDPISVITVAEKEEAYTDDQGVERTRLVPAATVIPGDQIIYTITFANKGTEAASNITITDPIPTQMRYVAGSAFGPGTDITFSADGGSSWGTPDELMVADADGNSRLASPAQYTHIRWKLKNPLDANTQAYAQFKAVLK